MFTAYRVLAILIALPVIAACASPAPKAPTGTEAAAPPPQARTPKVLTVAIQQEPDTVLLAIGGQNAAGAANIPPMIHDFLVTENDRGVFEPRLATEQISIGKGTWQVHPDGSMDTTWKIKPNVKWHDGEPFTSADLAFSFAVERQPEFTSQGTSAFSKLMQSVDTPDPLTLVVHWSGALVNANEARGLDPLPQHLLGALYDQVDKASFAHASYFTSDFVGLGPYKLTRWERGAFMEFAAFDGYYLGRPPLDTIVVKFIGDSNTMVANILANEVDVLLPIGVELAAALELKTRWEGTGNQVNAGLTGKLFNLEVQYRPEYARPVGGLTNTTVRQALFHAIDRPTLAQVQTQGLAPVADSYYSPNSDMHARLASDIPEFPYDPARAQQLLTEAGWVRGSDGVLVSQSSGERFETEVRADRAGGSEKAQAIIADNWKAVGAQLEQVVIPAQKRTDLEYIATQPGIYIIHPSDNQFWTQRFHSQFVASPANRWGGANRGGYVSPAIDTLLDKLGVTFDEREQLALHRPLLKEQIGNVVLMPLWWDVDSTIMRKGVKGPLLVRNTATWNIFTWDKEA